MGDEGQYARPGQEQKSSTQTGLVSSRTEDVVESLVKVLSEWRKLPDVMPWDRTEAAQWWIRMQEPPDPVFERPREMPVMGKGNESNRMEYPYIRRLCATLRLFLRETEPQQRFIVAAQEDGIWWRGKWKEHFLRVIKEVEVQKELGPEEYRKQAIVRIRRMKVGGKLPYDKGRRLGDDTDE